MGYPMQIYDFIYEPEIAASCCKLLSKYPQERICRIGYDFFLLKNQDRGCFQFEIFFFSSSLCISVFDFLRLYFLNLNSWKVD